MPLSLHGSCTIEVTMMDKRYSRRKFIQGSLRVVPVFLALGIAVNGCKENSKETKTPPADNCNDFSGLSEDDLKARQKLGYVKESPIAENTCSKCNLWLPPKQGENCGGCMLFKGPVYESAYCTYWTARQL